MGKAKPKSAVTAFMLAFFVPGLGHLYCGRPLLFLVFLLLINPLTALLVWEWILAVTEDGPAWTLLFFYAAFLFFPFAWIAQAIDAVLMAKGKTRWALVQQRRQARKGRKS